MSADIRPAELKDAAAVSQIMSDWIDQTGWMPKIHSDEEYRGYGKWLIEVSDVIVASMNGDVAGFLSRQENDIQAFYVGKEHRGIGVGTELLRHAKAKFQSLGLWTFKANTRAQAFYLKHGFVEDERTDGAGNDEKLSDIHYTWARKTND